MAPESWWQLHSFYWHEKVNDRNSIIMNIKTLRFVGTLEGISFLLLLGVAMPIKYIWDNPVFVKYIGMGHGVLFLLFLAVLLVVCHRMKWSLSIFNMGLIAAILPFGPFIFDRKIKKLAEQ
jgi:integral membrane protein